MGIIVLRNKKIVYLFLMLIIVKRAKIDIYFPLN